MIAVLAASFGSAVLRLVLVIVLAITTTLLSLRLLGSRRGWGTALLAGAIGWGFAALVALGVNDWDWGADGLVVHLLAIGIPATMAAAVVLDLLARPGSLALGERAGLVVTPRPVRAVRRRVSVLRRYRELVRLCRQEGFGPFLTAAERAERTVDAPGIRLRRVLEQAGGVYIKLGQIAATRVDLLPREVCDELAELQNRVPAESAGTHRAGARGRARAHRSRRSSPSSTGSRWRPRRSARPTGPGCTRASRSSSRCSAPTSRR